jgi:membrane-associated protease RseP (regulator of RpoE activity)
MQGKRNRDLDDDLDDDFTKKESSVPCAERHVKPIIVALAVAFLVIVGFMIFSPGRPGSTRMADAVGDGTEGVVNLFPRGQTPQGVPSAWRYIGQTYTCPKCGWQGNRLAIDELGNCVCPVCGYCAFKKNVQTAGGVNAVTSASPNLSLVRPMGIEVKDMLGGVMVAAVYGNSWADQAGMKQGDVLLRFNHENVVYTNQLSDLVAKAPPEKRVPVTVIRKGKKVKMDVWIGEGEMEGVVIPTPQAATGNPVAWGVRGYGQGLGQGFGPGGYAVCPGCGFRMLCQRGQACPLCPRCNNYMIAEGAMNQGTGAALQRGQGQTPWCPPR